MTTTALPPKTAPASPAEQGRLTFTTQVPVMIENDPDACVHYWQMAARMECYEPLGEPEVVHRVFRRMLVGGVPTYVSDDGEPVFFVTGQVQLGHGR